MVKPPALCVACEGTGVNSKNGICYPCNGTGLAGNGMSLKVPPSKPTKMRKKIHA